MRHLTIILAFLLIIQLASAWEFSNSNAELCFNVTNGGSVVGKGIGTWHSIMNITLPKNGTFFTSNIRGYYPGTDTNFDVFSMAENATNVFLLIPAMASYSGSREYCIYSGGTARNNISEIVPFRMGFDVQSDISPTGGHTNTGSYNSTWNGTYLILSSTNLVGYQPGATGLGGQRIFMIGKYRHLNSFGVNSDGGMISNRWNISTATASFLSNGAAIGTRNNSNISFGWYRDTTPTYLKPLNTTFNIFTMDYNQASGVIDAGMYNENMSFVDSDTNTITTYTGGYPDYSYLAYARNSTMEYDWVAAGYSDGNNGYATSLLQWDVQTPNITIQNPVWGSVYSPYDAVFTQVVYNGNFDNCSVLVNGAEIINYTNITYGYSPPAVIVSGSTLISGNNNITASCYNTGVEYHRYVEFTRSGADVDSYFNHAFGYNLSNSGCSADVITALSGCFESYNLSVYQPFGAVACNNVNLSKNYACLNATPATKNGYTIFYRPVTMNYPGLNGSANQNQPHVGANFLVSGTQIDGGIEIISNNSFIYIPAQNTSQRDCGVYYTNTSFCSWHKGFVLNNASILVSDRDNNWYTRAGLGVTIFDSNISMSVTDMPVYSVINGPTGQLFPSGIYTRLNCYERAGYYIIRVTNTLPQNFTITTYGNNSGQTTLQSTQLYLNLSMLGVTNISVSDDSGYICSYPVTSNSLLPFSLPSDFMPASYQIIVWAMMLFTVILTTMVPFAAILVLLFNDLYHVINVSEVSLVLMMAIIFGFVNNSFNMERGIKHLLIILGLATAYLAAVSPYATDAGVDLNGFDGPIKSFGNLAEANTIESFVFAIPSFIINLFWLLLTLPVVLMNLLLSLLLMLSPALYTAAKSLSPFITVGFVLYFYLKAYEVLANRFRPV